MFSTVQRSWIAVHPTARLISSNLVHHTVYLRSKVVSPPALADTSLKDTHAEHPASSCARRTGSSSCVCRITLEDGPASDRRYGSVSAPVVLVRFDTLGLAVPQSAPCGSADGVCRSRSSRTFSGSLWPRRRPWMASGLPEMIGGVAVEPQEATDNAADDSPLIASQDLFGAPPPGSGRELRLARRATSQTPLTSPRP